MKKLNKPYPPIMPQEFISYQKIICIYEGMSLLELLKEIPHNVDQTNAIFAENDYNHDIGVASLSYKINESNIDYEIQIKEYETLLTKYNEEKKIYDAWDNMNDTQKLCIENQRKASLKLKKINQLEKQLKQLKNE